MMSTWSVHDDPIGQREHGAFPVMGSSSIVWSMIRTASTRLDVDKLVDVDAAADGAVTVATPPLPITSTKGTSVFVCRGLVRVPLLAVEALSLGVLARTLVLAILVLVLVVALLALALAFPHCIGLHRHRSCRCSGAVTVSNLAPQLRKVVKRLDCKSRSTSCWTWRRRSSRHRDLRQSSSRARGSACQAARKTSVSNVQAQDFHDGSC